MTNTKSLLIAAAMAGALTAMPLAARAGTLEAWSGPSADKMGCNGKEAQGSDKDKASCKGMDKQANHKKDKHSCSGKDGCGGKDKAK